MKLPSTKKAALFIVSSHEDLSSRTNSSTLMPTHIYLAIALGWPSEENLSGIYEQIRQQGVTDTGDQHTHFTLQSWKSHSSSQTEMYELSTRVSLALIWNAYTLLNEWMKASLRDYFFFARNIFLSWRNIYIRLTDFLVLQPSVRQQLTFLEPLLLCFPTLQCF